MVVRPQARFKLPHRRLAMAHATAGAHALRLVDGPEVDGPGKALRPQPAPTLCSANTFIVAQRFPTSVSVHQLESVVRDLQLFLVRFGDLSRS
jgi:hypothetical protein